MNRKALLAALGAAILAPIFAFAQATEKDGVLVNGAGMTLYTFDKDAGGKSACNGPCAGNWPPLMAIGRRSWRPRTRSLRATTP